MPSLLDPVQDCCDVPGEVQAGPVALGDGDHPVARHPHRQAPVVQPLQHAAVAHEVQGELAPRAADVLRFGECYIRNNNCGEFSKQLCIPAPRRGNRRIAPPAGRRCAPVRGR